MKKVLRRVIRNRPPFVQLEVRPWDGEPVVIQHIERSTLRDGKYVWRFMHSSPIYLDTIETINRLLKQDGYEPITDSIFNLTPEEEAEYAHN